MSRLEGFHCIHIHVYVGLENVCFKVLVIFTSFRRVAKGGLFPKNTTIIGYARSDLSIEKLKEKCAPFLKVCVINGMITGDSPPPPQAKEDDAAKLGEFWAMNSYVRGSYTEKVSAGTLYITVMYQY